MDIEILKIKDKEVYLECLPWLKDIPFTDMTYLDCLAGCLTGKYSGVIGCIDKKPAGIMIYYLYGGSNCFIVGMWCRKNLMKFLETGMEFLKDEGVNKIRCSTSSNNYEYVGMKKLWTVYETDIFK